MTALLALPTDHLTAALALMGPEHVRWLASHEPFVDGLRTSLSPAEFAEVAARLLVVVPGEASRPVSARHEAHAQVARMMGNPEVTSRLLLSGATVVVLPQDVPLTGSAPSRPCTDHGRAPGAVGGRPARCHDHPDRGDSGGEPPR